MTRFLRAALGLVVGPLVVMGCGGNDTTATGGPSTTAGSGGSDASSTATSAGGAPSSSSAGGATSGSTAGGGGSGGQAGCVDVDGSAAIAVATAAVAGEHALSLPATSASHTSWREAANEALYLDVSSDTRQIGQLVLHQGHDGFAYSMSLGHLDAGEAVLVRVSALSAVGATPSACVGPATLTEAAELGDLGEALLHAPIFQWPIAKRFAPGPASRASTAVVRRRGARAG
jgi:hypothetical protein